VGDPGKKFYKQFGVESSPLAILPMLDLVSEGNIGLMKAVERFDLAKGGKLSTWWIKQAIKRALANQSKTIRLPVHLVDKISKMHRVALQMSEELGREPTDDEVAEEIGISSGKVSQLKTDKNLCDELRDLLKVLDGRERKIIFQRFGLDGGKPKTLEEVGKQFGVTRERIRQLQNLALAKMRGALRKKETRAQPSAGR
jgi:RNA polymerase primary sigma factor